LTWAFGDLPLILARSERSKGLPDGAEHIEKVFSAAAWRKRLVRPEVAADLGSKGAARCVQLN